MKATIVYTTIYDNSIIDELYTNMRKYDWLDHTSVIVIPDIKTPAGLYKRVKFYAAKGMKIYCPSFKEQEAFLMKVGLYPEFVPYYSDNRRNVGFLMALGNCDVLISIDDDNYPTDEDFVGKHLEPFTGINSYTEVVSGRHFYNPMDLLEYPVATANVMYPRGYPYKERQIQESVTEKVKEYRGGDIFINAGLWLQDPDVDGITWLVSPARSEHVKDSFKDVVLSPETWCPVNTQNTSIAAEAVATYYYIRMGYSLGGMVIDRYGDIFSGYFAQACAKNLGKAVKFGRPIVVHRRNPHNYYNDIKQELMGMVILENILDRLVEAKLPGSNAIDVYDSLSDWIIETVEHEMTGFGWTNEAKGFIHHMVYQMRTWTKVCRTICGA